MGKDPAVLFYTSDFISGTITMNPEQIGKYIILLCIQHQNGRMDKKTVMKVSGGDEAVLKKFTVDENGLFYNKRMENEHNKRKLYSESRRKNATSQKTYAKHMENENDNENVSDIEIGDEKKMNFKLNQVMDVWNCFAKKNNLQKVMKLTEKRKKAIIRRKNNTDFDLQKIFEEIENSDFLLGLKTDWAVNFDFIFCSENNYLKILEGQYKNGTNKLTGGTGTERRRNTEDKGSSRLLPSIRSWFGQA